MWITRPCEDNDPVPQWHYLAQSAGATFLHLPCIEWQQQLPSPTETTQWLEAFTKALASKPNPWLVFTSPTAVHFFIDWLSTHQISPTQLQSCLIAVVGPGTAQALESYGLHPALIATPHHTQGLLESLQQTSIAVGTSFFWPRSALAPSTLSQQLQTWGFNCHSLVLYEPQTSPLTEALKTQLCSLVKAQQPTCILFFSPSAVSAFQQLWETWQTQAQFDDRSLTDRSWPSSSVPLWFGSIGPSTTQALEKWKAQPIIEATPHTPEGLLHALDAFALSWRQKASGFSPLT